MVESFRGAREFSGNLEYSNMGIASRQGVVRWTHHPEQRRTGKARQVRMRKMSYLGETPHCD
jgi:hypothetical protein